MNTIAAIGRKHWAMGTSPDILDQINEAEINIAILDRDISPLAGELDGLIGDEPQFQVSGERDAVAHAILEAEVLEGYPLVKDDLGELLQRFSEVTEAKSFRLLLTTVQTNMCRKFHTDINDLRLLCTYCGPGTLWLAEGTANESKEVEGSVQQVETGSVVILKGAIYPKEGTEAILHRSPTIEESGERRLLLRLDTDEFLNF